MYRSNWLFLWWLWIMWSFKSALGPAFKLFCVCYLKLKYFLLWKAVVLKEPLNSQYLDCNLTFRLFSVKMELFNFSFFFCGSSLSCFPWVCWKAKLLSVCTRQWNHWVGTVAGKCLLSETSHLFPPPWPLESRAQHLWTAQ